MKISFSGLIALIALISIVGCNSPSSNKNNGDNSVRVVCLSKHLTEMIFALGKGSLIVGRDLTSNYPDSTATITSVGYHRALNPEGIISLRPTIVIHSNDIGPDQVIPQIEKAGLTVKVFPQSNTLDSSRIVLKMLAEYFGVPQRADAILKQMDMDLVKQQSLRKKCVDSPTVMVIQYGQASNRFFILSGRKGAADKMIEAAGGRIALYNGMGSRDLSGEAIAKANPDIILATDVGFEKLGSAEAFSQLPGVAVTNAYKNKKIFKVMEHDLVYFGPRTSQNIVQIMHILHPDLHE